MAQCLTVLSDHAEDLSSVSTVYKVAPGPGVPMTFGFLGHQAHRQLHTYIQANTHTNKINKPLKNNQLNPVSKKDE